MRLVKLLPLAAAVLTVLGFVLIDRWRTEGESPAVAPALQIPSTDRAARHAPPLGSAPQHAETAAFERSPSIRVNLTPSPVRSIRLAVDAAYRLRPVGSRQTLHRAERLAATDVTATEVGFRIGEKESLVSRLEIEPADSPAVWVGDHQYRGTVRLLRRPGRKFIAVNVLPLEHYVASVVDGEMPAAFPDAARQAQAIAARTYALYQMARSPDAADFDVYASTRSQKYLGFQYRDGDSRRLAGETDDGRRIARGTAGMVCTWNGRLFCTYYSAVCGGRTVRGRRVFSDAAPPLRSVPCHWCRAAERYRWTVDVPRSKLEQAVREHFESQGRPFERLDAVERAVRSDGPAFRLTDGRHRYRLSAQQLRRLSPAKLPSSRLTVDEGNNVLTFRGRGHGHGVGLCQWGARGLALAGFSALQILQHYYPGARVVALDYDIDRSK